uniref:Phosphoinositide phospholipase C n=1 Tax=Knipowitschia caucasica TaxID=637954 RepID=A0AAV2KCZ7_KNICA
MVVEFESYCRRRILDTSKQRQVRKKTVSFSSMPSDRKINSTAACMAFMMEGCEMKKVRSNSRMYNRYFLLDPDMRWLRWEPSKKDSEKAKLEIKSIKEVRLGKKTPILRSNGLSDQFPDECAFSIIYGDNYESLDLVASTADLVSTWGKKLPPSCPDSEGDVTDEEEGLEMSRRVGFDDKDQLNGLSFKRLRLCRELSDLVSLCKSVQFRDFDVSKREQKYWEICSFNEVDANRYANEFPEEFVCYNKRFLSRVYPTPMRIDASNMNPQDFWKCGCQIVAMNYQTPGLMMDLNLGWFRQNGNCGYVLRPAIMREEVSYFSANARDSLPGVSAQLLHIKVISGQNLPKPRGSAAKGDVVEPYIYVEIHGIPADCAEQRTKTVAQNGDNPIFDESFEFQINLPELAVLRFVVLDDDYIGDEFIGQYTIPFECLQPGYRHVPLQSLTGEFLPNTTLFVHVAITNRRGGGKAHKRGISVRKGRKAREYTTTKTTGIKVVDELFRASTQPLREATDLRENVQNAMVSFKELCGLTPAANMKQCILTVSTWLMNSERSLKVTVDLSEPYPTMEAQGPVPELLRKVLTAYDMMIQTSRILIESADLVYSKLTQAQRAGGWKRCVIWPHANPMSSRPQSQFRADTSSATPWCLCGEKTNGLSVFHPRLSLLSLVVIQTIVHVAFAWRMWSRLVQ